MSALVPYYGFLGARAETNLRRFSSFAPVLSRVVYRAYRNRRNIARLRTAVRQARGLRKPINQFRQAMRARGRSRRVEGAPTQNKQVMRYLFGSSSANDSLVRKTLLGAPIRWANAPNTNDGIRQAPSMRFKVSGFRICATLRNNADEPIHVHFAIVQPKEAKVTISDIKNDMLCDHNALNDRYVSFTDAINVASWDRTQDCANLNKRKFNILTHQRFQLNGVNSAVDQRERGSSYVHFEKYYPVNKFFEFETTSDNDVMKPVWVLIWYEYMFPNSTLSQALDVNVNVNSYVRNKNA